MAKFGLTYANFDPIPEGKDVVLRVKSVDDKKFESFGKCKIILEDVNGQTHTENFSIYGSDGKSENSIAMFLLSKFYMVAMDLDEITDGEEVELQDMVGKYIRCDITHEQIESTKKPGTFTTFSRLGREKTHAEGFDTEPTVKKSAPKKPLNLDDILG